MSYPQLKHTEDLFIPRHLIADRFRAGYLHAMQGLQLTRREHLRLSFREGYRAGKLYLRELRKQQGIYPFPIQGRMRFSIVR